MQHKPGKGEEGQYRGEADKKGQPQRKRERARKA
jgi:hypothetical protein